MKIVITNTVALNGGDSAILQSLVEILRAEFGEQLEISVFDAQGDVAQRYHPNLSFRTSIFAQIQDSLLGHNRLVRATRYAMVRRAATLIARGRDGLARALVGTELVEDLRTYHQADLVVSTGGTYLVENYRLGGRILDFEICQRLDAPLVFFTQSLGPFKNPRNRRNFKRFFEYASLALLRDERSRDHLRAIGVRGAHLQVVPDGVFAVAREEHLQAAKARTFPTDTPRIAISVRSWSHFRGDNQEGMTRYREAIAALVTELIDRANAQVEFVSTCQGIEEYWTDDSETAREIRALLPARLRDRVTVDGAFYPPRIMAEKLAAMDLVVATRMHMAILGLIAGTPVFPIVYEFKTRELFDGLGLQDYGVDINDIDAKTIGDDVARFIEALPSIREGCFDEVRRFADDARQAGALIRSSIATD